MTSSTSPTRWISGLALSCVLIGAQAQEATPEDSLRSALADADIVDLATLEGVAIDLRYASANNFLSRNVYGPFDRALLRRSAAEKLERASAALQAARPGWKILVLDALRPRSVQRLLWARVAGTSQQAYVADPAKGSVHNFGFALDVTLRDASGAEVDMGTPFDDFSERAQPRREAELVKSGALTAVQLENRQVLRAIMTGAGFTQLPIEWWHYDAIPAAEARAHHRILE